MSYDARTVDSPVDSQPAGPLATIAWDVTGQVDTESESLEIADIAHAIAAADAVRVVRAGEPPRCLLCARESEPGLVIVLKPAAVGMSTVDSNRYVMVCRRCRTAASEDTESAVVELARAGRQVDELLSLVRHRADAQLSGWWGGVGACTREAAEASSVAFRRAVERLKPFMPGLE